MMVIVHIEAFWIVTLLQYDISAVKMEAVCSSEMSGSAYKTLWLRNAEYHSLRNWKSVKNIWLLMDSTQKEVEVKLLTNHDVAQSV
jgi:hypothetical protein